MGGNPLTPEGVYPVCFGGRDSALDPRQDRDWDRDRQSTHLRSDRNRESKVLLSTITYCISRP